MEKCLTKQLVLSGVSGCLVEKPECRYAHKFGFSYECRHPEHAQFHAHVTGSLTREEVLERYNALRRKRRDEFTANLDETSRKFFCQQTGLFSQPPANMGLAGQFKDGRAEDGSSFDTVDRLYA